MCLPVMAAMAVVEGIQIAYGEVQKRKNAAHQETALREAAKVQQEQIYDQKSMQAQQRMHLAQQEKARLRAASAETGLTGISISDVLSNVDFQAGTDVANIQKADANELNASNSMLQSRLNQIQQPDWIAAGLQIATNTASDYSKMNPNASH